MARRRILTGSRRTSTATGALAAVLLGVAGVAATPTVASASPVACGATLTADTTLTADLRCPGANPALELATGVTLDLGGHAIVGNGTGTGVLAPAEGATVRNGTLRGWDVAVTNRWADPDAETTALTLVVEDARLAGNRVGLQTHGETFGWGWAPAEVRRTTFSGNGTGIDLTWYGRATVEGATFKDNGTGISSDASGVQISGTAFRRNTQALSGYETGFTVDTSTFTRNTDGIRVAGTSSLTLLDSTISGSGTAVDAALAYLVIQRSTISGNTTGVLAEPAGGTIQGTTFRGNGTAFSATVAPFAWDLVLQDNVVVRGGDGIVVQATGEDWTALKLGGNRVDGNTGWGIYAPGVTDLGGNTARGNGNEPQCTGVVCVPRRS
ncbi:right-handed parallel beta-helix repeat-containing protein [Cellulomonas sp.]|uniref:right-handed parallel beta-helix repeat-containing protein n=1 Tax=Cellulomonas sp. TaxID=40001 RepID=UPI001B245B2B|nr:right-handed parallel beta-helix repeat-containing protein [Cellulomonas sp.]MBO9554522.1 right-handed parallel beta-helix repeat-containing protein [Cellulomonas sp.]